MWLPCAIAALTRPSSSDFSRPKKGSGPRDGRSAAARSDAAPVVNSNMQRSPMRCGSDRPAEPWPKAHLQDYQLRLERPFGTKTKHGKHQIWTIWERFSLLFFVW